MLKKQREEGNNIQNSVMVTNWSKLYLVKWKKCKKITFLSRILFNITFL